MTTIDLTDGEALMFRTFMEHHETVAALVRVGLPEMTNGTITLHFDSGGKLRKIEKERVEWIS